MENLLEFGSNVNIDFIAICDFGNYKTGDIVLTIPNIFASLYYNSRTTSNNARFTELYYSDYSLAGININNVPLTESFYSLFSIPRDTNIAIIKREVSVGIDNTLYLLGNNIIEKTIQVDNLEGYIIHNNEGGYYITSDEIVNGKSYLVSYETLEQGHSFNLYSADVDIPYLKLQAQFIGNENKRSTEGYLIVPKVRLVYQPNIEFNANHVATCNLRAVVVDAKDNTPHLVVIEDGK